jgi:hypothetical protein
MSAQLGKADRARFGSRDPARGTDAEVRAAFDGYVAYFGTYEINDSTRAVTHHVQGASFPNWIGADLIRSFAFDESGRLQLANWMTRPDHPLTSRVMANRLWRWHFGRGIVATTDNFGRLGEKPSNQALLDWLALEFVRRGWSMKAMHRVLMLSNTYQMSSAYDAKAAETDPESISLWRMPRRRLEAEAIRDGIMATSGGLDLSMGGTILGFKDRQYVSNTEKRGGANYDLPRRAVYIPVVRSSMYEVFQAFDLPDSSTPSGDRNASVVAPQALFNVKGKDGGDAAKAYDLLARVAYTYTVAPKIGVYGELLPGYSVVSPKEGPSAKGLVIVAGVGGMMDVTDQVFVNVGMTMGVAPVTGIPLPFLTVGGSSIVANLVAFGVLQAIHARGGAEARRR